MVLTQLLAPSAASDPPGDKLLAVKRNIVPSVCVWGGGGGDVCEQTMGTAAGW